LAYPLIDLVLQNVPGPGVQVHSRIAKERHTADKTPENQHPPGVPAFPQQIANEWHAGCGGNPSRTGPDAGCFSVPAKQFLHEQGQGHKAAIEHEPEHRDDRDASRECSVLE
jgi:hypothetical protein